MALPDPPDAGIAEGIVEEKEPFGQTPLAIAKADAKASGKMLRPPAPSPKPINLSEKRPSQSDEGIYLRFETRERLSRLALLMSCSYAEVVRALSTLDYRPKADVLLGYIPGEELPKRDVRVRANMDKETVKRWEHIAKKCRVGRVKHIGTRALDEVLGGRIVPTAFATLEDAAASLRRSPLTDLEGMASDAEGRILLRISSTATRGIIAIMNDFDHRRNWQKVRFRRTVEAMADLQVAYQLVGDIAVVRRSQRPFVLPMWAIQKLTKVGMDNLLVSQPAFRRPSSLVSEALEYIGQGAIQLIHARRGTDSLESIRALRGGKK